MVKVFRLEEIPKNQRVTYSESYEVKYVRPKPGTDFTEQATVMYFAASKGRHDQVEAKFRRDFAGKFLKIISVTYQ
jgi:hypothetical protein